MSLLRSSCQCIRQSSLHLQRRSVTTKQLLGANPPIPSSSPLSLHYEPRPYEYARYDDLYHDIIAPDLLAMTYKHYTEGELQSTNTNALRPWDGSSPYHRGRSNRPLRGNKPLKPLPQPRTHRNVPKIDSIHVSSMVKESLSDRNLLVSVVMAYEAITGEKPEIVKARHSVAPWQLREGMPCGVKIKLQGVPMLQFLSTVVEVVLPSLKDFTGLPQLAGDGNGNVAFGLDPSALTRFPEIEASYEQYAFLPGCHIVINTTALNDKEARQLLSGYGLPFIK